MARWSFDWIGYSQLALPGWSERRDGYVAETAGDLAEAVAHFRRALEEKPDDRATARRVEWLEDLIRVEREPVVVPRERLESYAGGYGRRKLSLDDDGLVYQRQGHDAHRLVPVSQSTFALQGLLDYRIEVRCDRSDRPVKLVVHYIDGSDEAPRDPD